VLHLFVTQQPVMAAVTPDISRGPVLLSFSSITASLAFSTTLARFYVRTRTSRSIGPDDYAVVMATVRPSHNQLVRIHAANAVVRWSD
jgi:hypothetical protein